MRLAAVALLSLSIAAAASAQLPPIVKSAFDAVDVDQEKWAFTKTSVEDGAKTVETFDPSRPEGARWQLVMKNGHAPDKGEIASYAAQKTKPKRNKNTRTFSDINRMIRPGSLKLLRETPAELSYEFRLPAETGDKDGQAMVDLLRGRLTIAKDGPWLRTLEIENEKPMKPVVAVRIDRIYTLMTFQAPAAGMPALLTNLRASIRGRALMVKSLDHDSAVTFSEYRRVAR